MNGISEMSVFVVVNNAFVNHTAGDSNAKQPSTASTQPQ